MQHCDVVTRPGQAPKETGDVNGVLPGHDLFDKSTVLLGIFSVNLHELAFTLHIGECLQHYFFDPFDLAYSLEKVLVDDVLLLMKDDAVSEIAKLDDYFLEVANLDKFGSDH